MSDLGEVLAPLGCLAACSCSTISIRTKFFITSSCCIIFSILRILSIFLWAQPSLQNAYNQSVQSELNNLQKDVDVAYDDFNEVHPELGLNNTDQISVNNLPEQSISFLWLDFAMELLLLSNGLILFSSIWDLGDKKGYNSTKPNGYTCAISLHVTIILMTFVVVMTNMILHYPGNYINPDTVFGIFSIVFFCVKFLILFYLTILLFMDQTFDEYSHVVPGSPGGNSTDEENAPGGFTGGQVFVDNKLDQTNPLSPSLYSHRSKRYQSNKRAPLRKDLY